MKTLPVEYDPFDGKSIELIVPATESQIEIWTSVQLGDDANCAFNESIALRLAGQLDKPALIHALETIVSRHDALRTTFSSDGLTLIVSTEPWFEFSEVDFSSLSDKKREQQISRLLKLAGTRPFHLEQGPLFRVKLAKLSADEHLLLITSHHIICDGWSIWVILEELGAIYSAQSTNTMVELQNPYPFSAYARQQHAAMNGPAWQEDEQYWIKKFSPPPAPLDLPATGKRPGNRSFQASRLDYIFPSGLVTDLKTLAARRKTTLTVVLLAAFSAFLSRICRNPDPVIGVPAAGQASSGQHYLVGHCVNLLPMFCSITPLDSFYTYLERYRLSMLDAFEHQQYTYGSLLKKLRLSRDSSRSPLVSVLFNIDQGLGDVEYGDLTVNYFTPPRAFENFEIFLNASEIKGRLQVECQYNTDLFSKKTVGNRLAEFEYFLKCLVDDPDLSLADVPIVPPKQQHILENWNDTVAPVPGCGVHNLFEKQAGRCPEKTAVRTSSGNITYQELNQKADSLAKLLRQEGVGHGSLVGIYLTRSLDMIIAMLAILKSGAAYVPLDPNYPEQRITFMAESSGLVLILTTKTLAINLSSGEIKKACLDEMKLQPVPPGDADIAVQPDDLMYVIYTSGSTGQPKGVQIHHQAVVNFLLSMAKRPGMAASDTLLAVTTFSFDIAVLEIFLPLVTGATIVLADAEVAADAFALLQLMEDSDPTIMQATPATWQMLLAAGWRGKSDLKILCGGEALPAGLARKLLPSCGELWNMYGPTETTIWSTCYQVIDPEGLFIGQPISNTTVHILDENSHVVPIGIPGELCIGGLGVSKGYINRDDLTKKQFILFSNDQGSSIIYKTGDLARWREDGLLEYFNRLDHQIKIRGFRVEAGEIETALETHPDIIRSAVTVVEASEEDNRLAAFFTAASPISTRSLREHLRSVLPAYMIPQHFVQLEELPLTPAGKIDRKQLLSSLLVGQGNTLTTDGKSFPDTEQEKLLLEIWKELLGHSDILPEDNFFDIGGHSLLATQAVALLREKNFQVNLRNFFEFPTIRTMASFLGKQKVKTGGTGGIPAAGYQEKAPLSLQQQRLWYLEKFGGQATVYNLPAAFRIFGNLDVHAFESGIQKIFDRHESLRTGIIDLGSRGEQLILKEYEFSLRCIDLQDENENERNDKLLEIIIEETGKPFDITSPPLFKAVLFVLSPDEHVFYFMPHHAIWDGWSFDIFLHELRVNYESITGYGAELLPVLPVQYADFARWQHEWLEGDDLHDQLEYWSQHLKNDLTVLELATDYLRPREMTYDKGASEPFWLPSEKTERLTEIAHHEEATLFMILLTAYGLLLHHYSGNQKTILIGAPISGRHHQECADLIGFFVNMLTMKIRIDPDLTFSELLRETRKICLDAFRHQEVPFERLIELLNPPRDTSRHPIFQVMFAYQDVRNRKRNIADLRLEQINIARSGTQTDIDFWVRLADDGLAGGFEYNGELFESGTIRRMLRHYGNILDAVIADPARKVSEISMMRPDEQAHIVNRNYRVDTGFKEEGSFPERISRQAMRSPANIALIFNDVMLTYKDLDNLSSQWAHLLLEKGVKPGDTIGICMERSDRMLICLLGIAKTGAAYLPLDPYYPEDRLAYMVEDSDARFILTEIGMQEKLKSIPGNFLFIDKENFTGYPVESPTITIDPESLAYVIYTSGSTGRPKGVQVPHRALSNFLSSMSKRPGIAAEDRLLAITTLSFDICALELLLPLVNGAVCVLADRETGMDGKKLAALMDKEKITIMQATPGTWRMLIASGWQGNEKLRMLCGGEAFPLDLKDQLLQKGKELWNMYGPTETTIWSTCGRILKDEPVSIGIPINNTRTYILNEYLQPVPPGVPGELYIGGAGVSLGYRNKKELTQRHFTADPFADRTDNYNVMYKTGDLVRELGNGRLEYLMRMDNQVKIRGYRIELGEIESLLANHPAIVQAVAVVRQEQEDDVRLVAYCIQKGKKQVAGRDLGKYLRQFLPDYMIPQHFVSVDSIPLTPAGKVDRKRLAAMEPGGEIDEKIKIAPRTDTEKKLYPLWEKLLKIPDLGIEDSFFDAGGHSLLAVTLFAEIEKLFNIELPLATLFRYPTIHTLASYIDAECYVTAGEDAQESAQEEYVF